MHVDEIHCVPIQYCTIQEGQEHNRFWRENLKSKECFEDFAVDGDIILNCILKKQHR
jgi:hypothetical protein